VPVADTPKPLCGLTVLYSRRQRSIRIWASFKV
jgi:hypothetical protein